VRELLIGQYNRLRDEDRGFAEGMNLDQYETVASVSENLRLVYVYYKTARPFDTRFKYYDFLNAIYLLIEELKQRQETEQDPEVKNQLMEKYSIQFITIREALDKENEKKSTAKPALWLGIIAV